MYVYIHIYNILSVLKLMVYHAKGGTWGVYVSQGWVKGVQKGGGVFFIMCVFVCVCERVNKRERESKRERENRDFCESEREGHVPNAGCCTRLMVGV